MWMLIGALITGPNMPPTYITPTFDGYAISNSRIGNVTVQESQGMTTIQGPHAPPTVIYSTPSTTPAPVIPIPLINPYEVVE